MALDAIFTLDAYASELGREEPFSRRQSGTKFSSIGTRTRSGRTDRFGRRLVRGSRGRRVRGVRARGIPARLVAALGELNAAAAEETASASSANLPTNASFSDPARRMRRSARHRLRGVPRVRRASFDDDDWSSRCRGRRRSRGDGRRSRRARVTRARGFFPPLASLLSRLLARWRRYPRDASAAASMRRAGAVPKLARFLQWEDPETRDVAFRALRNVCASSRAARTSRGRPARCRTSSPSRRPNRKWRTGRGTTRRMLTCRMLVGTVTQRRRVEVSLGANGDGAHWLSTRRRRRRRRASLRPLAAFVSVNSMASASRKTRQKLAECGALDAYVRLLRGDAGRSAAADAARAVSAWSDDEPWLVEAKLMEPDADERPRGGDGPWTRADATTLEALAHTLARSPRARDALFAAGAFTRVAAALRESNWASRCRDSRSRGAGVARSPRAGHKSIAPGGSPRDVARRVARGGASFVCRARRRVSREGREGRGGGERGEGGGGDARLRCGGSSRAGNAGGGVVGGGGNTRRRRRRARRRRERYARWSEPTE